MPSATSHPGRGCSRRVLSIGLARTTLKQAEQERLHTVRLASWRRGMVRCGVVLGEYAGAIETEDNDGVDREEGHAGRHLDWRAAR